MVAPSLVATQEALEALLTVVERLGMDECGVTRARQEQQAFLRVLRAGYHLRR